MLNRVVRWTTHGLEYQTDLHQIERLIDSQGLHGSCSSVVTLGLKPIKEQMEAEPPLEAKLQTPYRADVPQTIILDKTDPSFSMRRIRSAD